MGGMVARMLVTCAPEEALVAAKSVTVAGR